MPKPICPKQALAAWKKTPVGQASFEPKTLKTTLQLQARVKLAFMAGFDAGAKAEHKKHRVEFVRRNAKG